MKSCRHIITIRHRYNTYKVVFINHPSFLCCRSSLLFLLCFRNNTRLIDVSDIEKSLKDTAQLHTKIKQKLNETKDYMNVTAELLDEVNILLNVSLSKRNRFVVSSKTSLFPIEWHKTKECWRWFKHTSECNTQRGNWGAEK